MSTLDIKFEVCQPLKDGALYYFYKRNNICEAGYGKELCEVVLKHEGVWVAAYDHDELIGFARALFDGVTAEIMEVCLDLRYQDENQFENGCFIESDPHGIARAMALTLLKELRTRGCCFFSVLEFGESASVDFYERLGFYENKGHKNYVIDTRPYVPGGNERGEAMDKI